MTRDEAIQLISEALNRIINEQKNANGGNWQAGGTYWRLMKVLRFYVLPEIYLQEGEKHAQFLATTHGVPGDIGIRIKYKKNNC